MLIGKLVVSTKTIGDMVVKIVTSILGFQVRQSGKKIEVLTFFIFGILVMMGGINITKPTRKSRLNYNDFPLVNGFVCSTNNCGGLGMRRISQRL